MRAGGPSSASRPRSRLTAAASSRAGASPIGPHERDRHAWIAAGLNVAATVALARLRGRVTFYVWRRGQAWRVMRCDECGGTVWVRWPERWGRCAGCGAPNAFSFLASEDAVFRR